MEGGSRDLLQPWAGATVIYHLEVSREYWRELLKEERNLDELSADYSLCLLHLRKAAAEVAEHRLEGLRLGVDNSRLSRFRQRLLVEHEMLTPTVHPVPMQNMEEIQRDEETILLAVEDLRVETHHEETTTAECLNAHRLAVQKLCVCVHSLDAYQQRQAVGGMLRQAKVLLRQIHAKYKEGRVRLRQTMQQIVERPVENNKIRAMNASLSSFIHDLQYKERTAAPTQEGGVESQTRPQNWTTTLCTRWKQSGACSDGDRCVFVQGKQDQQHRIPLHPLYKTKPCFYFLSTSGCKNGDNCGYLHVKQEQEQEQPMPHHPLYRTKPCLNFFSPWGCKNGDSCCFLHVSPPPE